MLECAVKTSYFSIFTYINIVSCTSFLWSPYGIRQTIIYIFMLSFVLLSSFFPLLIPAVADWMSAILAHSVALVRI